MSLLTLFRLEGRSATLSSVNAHLPARDRHSLSELRDAARACGLSLRGVRLTARDWPLDRPALVHLERRGTGHFVVLRPVGHTGRLVQIIDPVVGTEVQDASRFFASPAVSGAALVPLRYRDDPRLRVALAVSVFAASFIALAQSRNVARAIRSRRSPGIVSAS